MKKFLLVLFLFIFVSCRSEKVKLVNEQRFLDLFFDARINENVTSLIDNLHFETVNYFQLNPAHECLRGYLIAESSLFEGVQFDKLDYRIVDFTKSSNLAVEDLEFLEQYKPKSTEVVRIKIEINRANSSTWRLTTFAFVDWETRRIYDLFIPYSL